MTERSGYNAIEVLPTPVEELLEPGFVLPPRLALSDQRRVCCENHALLHATVVFRGDLAIFELMDKKTFKETVTIT